MSEDQPLASHEHSSYIPVEEQLRPHEPILLNPDFPLREEDGFNVLTDIHTNRTSMDDPRADSFMIVDLAAAPGDMHGNKWFQGSLIHGSTRYLLVDANLHNIDMERDKGYKGVRTGKTVTIGSADETAVSRFNPSEYVDSNHFSVTLLENGQLQIQDNGSSHGTRIRFGAPNYEDIDDTTHEKNPRNVEKQHIIVEVGEVIEGKKNPCEDTILHDAAHNVYGIFDGAGGHGNGDKASQLASEKSSEYMSQIAADSTAEEMQKGLIEGLKIANTTVMQEASGGITTGTIAKIGEENGQKYVAWASVGDSPIMVFNRVSGYLTRVSRDEILSPERANEITNAIGTNYMDVFQSGVIQMQPGDEIIICSDGITGDYPPDILSDQEIIQAMQSSNNPHEAARALLQVSRKSDDKAVLVLQ